MKNLKLRLLAITVATTTIATIPSIRASAAWTENEGNWYYSNDSGEMKTGWINDNGAWYYLNNSGEMKTGWINDNDTWYYLNNSGEMKTGWVNDNGKWYYTNNLGEMKTGWINDNGTWYFSDISGSMQTGVVQVDGKTYSLDAATGAMQVGDITINGEKYTFAQSGEAIGSDLVPSKVFNSDGSEMTGTNTSGKDTNASDASNTAVSDTSASSQQDSSSSIHHNSSSSNSSSKVAKAALTDAITVANTKYISAVEGTDVGQYAVGSKAIFKTAIDVAQVVVNNVASTQADIDSAVTALATATTTFDNSSNSSKVAPAALTDAITVANTKYTSAVEGTDVGQYAVGSKAIFKAAIDAAQLVANNAASTQADIDSAVTAIATAMTTFDNSINKEDINAGVSTSHLEDYREQYHYSVPSGWGNDPNGMVYFNGEWHLFYQYYPDGVSWGPMHWAQAVSTDLIHWQDLGIAIAPGDVNPGDGQKYIFSGSAVVDKDNTSGFFDGIEGGGLVAAYTEDNNVAGTQQQCIAYSKDNGRTWTKYNNGNPVLTNAQDPVLGATSDKTDFRDPKIFWSEDANEWMMVAAGGPLRFFSSKDLKTWKAEGNNSSITTECPDIFKLEVGDTGTYKWVLSQGGRYYRVGEFKQVDGVWNFVPDDDQVLPMNFAPDAYAAQTYYGTGENGTPDGRRIMIQWMNNWNYANSIGQITQTFNGQYTLQNELKLVQTTGGAIRLTQEPIKEYESLRQTPTTFNNVTISPNQPNIMSNLSGSQYEIVSEFTPDANTTEVGFNLRVGKDAGQETVVKYNTETGEVTIDRSKSGKAPNSSFNDPAIGNVTKTADGKIKLDIFVDSSSVEVYANDGEITGAAQIFPNRSSEGIEVYSVGGSTQATIQYYPLSGIWNNDIKGTNSVALSLSESNFTKELGEQFSIYTTTIPTTAAQGVNWTISDPSVVKIVSQDDSKTTFEVTGIGNTDLTATSKDGKSKKTASLSVYDRDVTPDISNLTGFQSTSGNWFVNKDNGINTYTADTRGIGDGFVTAEQMDDDFTATYTYTADAKILTGDVASLVLYSQTRDASQGSIVANIIKDGSYRVFNYTAGQNVASGNVPVDPNGIYHLKAEIQGIHVKYWINGTLVCDADQPYYNTPGYFGLNACNAEVEFTNINVTKTVSDTSTLELSKTDFTQNVGDTFTVYGNQAVNWKIADTNVIQVKSQDDSETIFDVVGAGQTTAVAVSVADPSVQQTINIQSYQSDPTTATGLVEGLTNFKAINGNWYVDENGAYTVNADGDAFTMADPEIDLLSNPSTKYIFQADVNITTGACATLMLVDQDKNVPNSSGLGANINNDNGEWRIFQFSNGNNLVNSDGVVADGHVTAGKNTYKLRAELQGNQLEYFIDDVSVWKGTTPLTSGYFGLDAWNSNTEFTNIKLTDDTDTTVTDSTQTSTTGAAVTDGTQTSTTGAAVTDSTQISTTQP